MELGFILTTEVFLGIWLFCFFLKSKYWNDQSDLFWGINMFLLSVISQIQIFNKASDTPKHNCLCYRCLVIKCCFSSRPSVKSIGGLCRGLALV